MSKPTNEWYCKDLRNTVINRQKREINRLKKENEKLKNKIRELIKDPTIITSDGDYVSVKKIKKLLEED